MNLFRRIYLDQRFFLAMTALVLLFIIGQYLNLVFLLAKITTLLFIVAVLLDFVLLFGDENISAQRKTPSRLSNGDENMLWITIEQNYNFPVELEIIDEIPHQFQKRDFMVKKKLEAKQKYKFSYTMRPTQRGEYSFGALNIYAISPIHLIKKRYSFDQGKMVAVYPSFIQMRKYELFAISNRLTEVGVKKIRRISNNNEFEQIKEYVLGDDIRTINWKATARRNALMVNQYQDEKSQQVYSIIDMGRTMKMPFAGLSLLDYAINTALVISNIAKIKHDKPGIITVSKGIHQIVAASNRNAQMKMIMEALYRQQTRFQETNFELLYATIKHKIPNRSLLMIYTNFEGISSMRRQLKYYRLIAKHHVLMVVFFENSELSKLIDTTAHKTAEVYKKALAEKLLQEKRQIVSELRSHSIYAILTKPEDLTINSINKYLELKSLGRI